MAQDTAPQPAVSLDGLPSDELVRHARLLGLSLDVKAHRTELLRLIRQRETLIESLDRDALLDIVVWMRVPVRPSDSRFALVAQILGGTKVQFDGLSDRGLEAMAKLRDVTPRPGEARASIERRLRKAEGFWSRLRRVRRSWMASLVERAIEPDRAGEEYRFLPDDDERKVIRERIENVGVVSGLARTLRGVADDYVAEKLDEIERRIDRKLDQIDQRLCEWRDREVANRLRLIKITLVSTLIVAVISLGYEYVKRRANGANEPGGHRPPAASTPQSAPPP
ncbi:MAG: hypothetical protein IT449_00670 [Phycisphaerales bacterium]|nr:hypothetical protein [Phycisphaerales bacterium]